MSARIDKLTGRPLHPRPGDVWHEPYTKEIRLWNGKRWQETTARTMMDDIKRIKEESQNAKQS